MKKLFEMKKVLLVALLALMVSAFVFTACGSDNDTQENDVVTEEAAEANDDEDAGEVEEAASGSDVIQAFIDESADELNEVMGATLGDIATLEIYAGTGNEMVIATIYTEEMDDDTIAEVAAALEAAMDAMAPVMLMVAEEGRNELDLDYFTVTASYRAADGSVIFEQSFTAE